MKKCKYLYMMILIFLGILFLLNNSKVFANAIDPVPLMDVTADNLGPLAIVGGKIFGIVLAVGGAVAIIGLVVMGIRYMMASPSEKGDIKKDLIGFVVGALILICALTLVGIAFWIGQQINLQAF